MADAAVPETAPSGERKRGRLRAWLAGARTSPVVSGVEIVLAVCGSVFLVVGGVDAATAGPLPAKVLGGVLTLVGGGLIASALGLRPHRRWTGAVGVLSIVAASAIALYLCLNAWDEEPLWSVGFGTVSFACAVALVVLVRECPPVFGVKSASLLSVAGFALAFFQFTYAESARIRVGSTLTLSSDLAPAGEEPVDTVEVIVRSANPTAVKIQSLGSLYVVEGVRHCRRTAAVDDHVLFDDVFEHPGTVAAFSPRVAERAITTIQAGKLFDDRTYFEPGEEVVRRFSVPIPRRMFDLIRLRVAMAVANGERLHLGEALEGPGPIEGDPEGIRGVAVTYRVSEQSVVDRIVHGDRVVEVEWESGTDERLDPRLSASADLAGERDDERDLSASYGLAYARSTTELPLDRPPPLTALPPSADDVADRPDVAPACRGDF
ncbi:MAG: hypothetical protein M3279_00780 [Actinomycetota bacterium]|nr:hypothetical protein [Actinomycetota bacterium]